MSSENLEKTMSSDEELSLLAKDIENGNNLWNSFTRLSEIDRPIATWHKYSIRRLTHKYLSYSKYAAVARIVITKIRKLERDQGIKEHVFDEPASSIRKRALEQPKVVEARKTIPMFKIPRVDLMLKRHPRKGTSQSKSVSPSMLDVSKMQNLPESEYDRIRPTLIYLPAKELKSFMDRNPEIEKVADGLFRRHCQMDCPEEVARKVPSEKWRTLHDVHVNWKAYEETKQWETKLKERLKMEENLMRLLPHSTSSL